MNSTSESQEEGVRKDQKLSVMMYGRNAFVHFITYEYSLCNSCYLQLSFIIYIDNNIIL